VATKYHWDRRTFLEQTCHKAGLPSDAWREGAKIFTFSAEIFHEVK
jgi:AMMECR1 domain-containing protein